MMIEEDIGCLPVVDQDEIVGIITDTDIYQTFVGLLGGGREGARSAARRGPSGDAGPGRAGGRRRGGNIISVVTWQNRFDGLTYLTIGSTARTTSSFALRRSTWRSSICASTLLRVAAVRLR